MDPSSGWGPTRTRPVAAGVRGATMDPPVQAGLHIDKGLIGFDVGTGSDIVRPELLRLVNRGTQTTAEKQSSYALAA